MTPSYLFCLWRSWRVLIRLKVGYSMILRSNLAHGLFLESILAWRISSHRTGVWQPSRMTTFTNVSIFHGVCKNPSDFLLQVCPETSVSCWSSLLLKSLALSFSAHMTSSYPVTISSPLRKSLMRYATFFTYLECPTDVFLYSVWTNFYSSSEIIPTAGVDELWFNNILQDRYGTRLSLAWWPTIARLLFTQTSCWIVSSRRIIRFKLVWGSVWTVRYLRVFCTLKVCGMPLLITFRV